MEKKFALEHVSWTEDGVYEQCCDDLNRVLKLAYSGVMFTWIEKGIITDEERIAALKRWDFVDLLDSGVFDPIFGE